MMCSENILLWNSNYWDVYLRRVNETIKLIRIFPLDYESMEEYIDNNHDIYAERQDAVYHWNTRDGYDEWRQDYSYNYDDYFCYDGDADVYYDDNDDCYTYDYIRTWSAETNDFRARGVVVQETVNAFNSDYLDGNFSYAQWMNDTVLLEKIGELYDNCVKFREYEEERRKPHWNVFSYYK